ncbi:protein-L-isoaspartate O-methyltransferase [Aquabacterium olei]|uniref:Protein-L-isoaspartate O-methyltransferase n=1 Tax=Aquabacterium olei TaxID=1296669 RepID=A0A2U8FPR2_9BURK|nr:protein-L-isoaspartate O-methyltransferase [Aquabacterium olei]AWI52999.1 protein-L-isoaspartate O-methyltransferase [Aquabacterium olei]
MSHGHSDKPRRFPLQLNQVATARPAASRATPTVAAREVLRPQTPLAQAEQDRRRAHTPGGVGLDSVRVRARMVERLKADGLSDARVLAAFAAVPRHQFVDTALVNQAYEDTSLPIGLGQTISKPSVVGAMMQLLCERPDGPVARDAARPLGVCLEIGTGCGYQAALLALLARRVVSIERVRELHVKARAHLDAVEPALPTRVDIRLLFGDGMLGHAPGGPYDTIIAAAGGQALPQAWLDQLAPGGRLVAPVDDGRPGAQVLTIVDRLADGTYQTRRAGAVLFVPLKSGTT